MTRNWEKLGHTGSFQGVGRFRGLAGSQWELLDQSRCWCMQSLVGVVNNGGAVAVRNHPEWHFDTGWASAANRNVSRLHGWGFTVAAVWRTLTWYSEHSASPWLGDRWRKMCFFLFFFREREAGEVLAEKTLLVWSKSQVTSKLKLFQRKSTFRSFQSQFWLVEKETLFWI